MLDERFALTVPPTLSLTLAPTAAFGSFTPGVDKEYTASTTATVTSTGGRREAVVLRSRPPHERRVLAAVAAGERPAAHRVVQQDAHVPPEHHESVDQLPSAASRPGAR